LGPEIDSLRELVALVYLRRFYRGRGIETLREREEWLIAGSFVEFVHLILFSLSLEPKIAGRLFIAQFEIEKIGNWERNLALISFGSGDTWVSLPV
jgi:hypothetical protein